MKSVLNIVKFSTDYLEQVAQLEKECFSDAWSATQLMETCYSSSYIFFVALIGNKVAGYVIANNVAGDLYIERVATSKEIRGKGVAGGLLNALLNRAKNSSVNFATLEVRKSNIPAIMLYEKFGFNPVGERPDFYSNPKENAIIMTIDGEDI